jgi:hypothetical protein
LSVDVAAFEFPIDSTLVFGEESKQQALHPMKHRRILSAATDFDGSSSKLSDKFKTFLRNQIMTSPKPSKSATTSLAANLPWFQTRIQASNMMRVGRFSIRSDIPPFESPTCLTYTQNACLPHMTNDIFESLRHPLILYSWEQM